MARGDKPKKETKKKPKKKKTADAVRAAVRGPAGAITKSLSKSSWSSSLNATLSKQCIYALRRSRLIRRRQCQLHRGPPLCHLGAEWRRQIDADEDPGG